MTDGLLTAEEKHQLMSVLQAMDAAAPQEKRANIRRKVLMDLWIRHLAKAKHPAMQKVLLVDVSRKGLAFLSRKASHVGDKLCVRLEFGEGGSWLVLCEVRNVRKLASGHYKIGTLFLERIEDNTGTAKIPGDWLAYAA